ncbi:Halomucin [Frankliniella fusca]|uniref:Halomucin n=1 Tax=Frankliniella fusca TaxID=407009 RepID=A0AAE1HFW0_9NEOP|nr:Halomucin [Frankliniella fusca]
MDKTRRKRKLYRKRNRDREFQDVRSGSDDESDSSVEKRARADSSKSESDSDLSGHRSSGDLTDSGDQEGNADHSDRERIAARINLDVPIEEDQRIGNDDCGVEGRNSARIDLDVPIGEGQRIEHVDIDGENIEVENEASDGVMSNEDDGSDSAMSNEDEGTESEHNSDDEQIRVEVNEDSENEYETADDEDDDNILLHAEEVDNEFDDQLLYEDAPITFRESLLAILTFVLSHRLTGVCVSDLLSLIVLHCRPNNLCLKSLSKFREYFSMIAKKIIIPHHYCSICQVLLDKDNPVCEVDPNHTVLYFIEMPIVSQLQAMFKRPGFYELLQYRFQRQKQSPNNIEDIYDGNIYKELFNSGFLSNPNNLSFSMYFDGVSLFKSSSFSLWPVYFSINELKYKYRTQKENIVLAGLWFGPKPNVNLLLRPLYNKMLQLERNGVSLSLPDGNNVTVRAKVLAAVGDLPAKAAFMRFINFNGLYSCFNCLSSGGRHEVGAGITTVQVYPYSRNFVLRTTAETSEFAEQAVIARQADPKASVYGVKGPSLLSYMLPDFIKCMAIDIMHGSFLGVMKTLMGFWFDSSFSTSPFSIRQYTDIVNTRLKGIKPPFSFQRLPRSLKDLPLYKASDFKIFMFHYSLPVLLGILPVNYWVHHSKFVAAISMLCQESISPDQLNDAEELLHSFVSDFQELYGLRYLGLNVHQLLHLVDCVRSLGPAFVYSCFFYESVNGQLARLVHGTRHSALQICSSISVLMNLPSMINAMNDNEAKSLCLKFLFTGRQKVKVIENINPNTHVAGVYSNCYPIPLRIRRLLEESFNIFGGQCKYFHRLKKKGIIYCSEQYVRSNRKVSCFAEIFSNGTPYLCKILTFLKWSACNFACPQQCQECPKMFLCMVREYERIPWELVDHNISIGYLNKVTCSRNIKLFLIEEIRSVCVYIVVGENEYLSVPVNSLEIE